MTVVWAIIGLAMAVGFAVFGVGIALFLIWPSSGFLFMSSGGAAAVVLALGAGHLIKWIEA